MKDFQEIVLEELRSLKEGQRSFEERLISFEERLTMVDKKLDAVYEQTADLTEFRAETNKKLDLIIENQKSMYEMLGEHEVAIRTLRRRPV